MPVPHKRRTLYFIGCEGDNERAFVAFLHECADEQGLNVHLVSHKLRGGGYQQMLAFAVKEREKQKEKGSSYKKSFLMIDTDRGDNGDDISIEKLRKLADAENFILICQIPCIEALFVRLIRGNENMTFSGTVDAKNRLSTLWPEAKKPIDKLKLMNKFSFEDVQRAAHTTSELKSFLALIGFKI
jgi:hypothetical protein